MELQGKVIVITGAAQGLGQKMAEIVAGQGANSHWSISITQSSRRRYGSARKQAARSKTTPPT
jgi:NAD(P)-dependent dehydrogenase (short-subunit alcohol dehydrogenase family)